MSYAAYETSVHDAAPVECYRFTGPSQSYRYTSSERDQVLLAETFIASSIKRNTVRGGSQSDDRLLLEIELPFDADVVRDYAYALSPSRLLVELFRVHRGTTFDTSYTLLWKGKATSFSVEGRVCKIRVPSIFTTALEGDVPTVFWQTPCNHTLYDSRCQASRAAHSIDTVVVAVADTSVTVETVGSISTLLPAGEIVLDRTGERRLIVGTTANTLVVNYPFSDILEGDECTLSKGCNHSFATCVDTFDNGVNYGGYKDIPGDNPFQGGIG